MENLIIRLETQNDYRAVENLTREAFWNVYKPGADEHYFVHMMRNHPDFLPALAFVLEKDGKIIEKGTMCKMARGEMVRYMAEHQIKKPDDIRSFDRLDYAFDPVRSDESTYVFVKRGEAPCSLD